MLCQPATCRQCLCNRAVSTHGVWHDGLAWHSGQHICCMRVSSFFWQRRWLLLVVCICMAAATCWPCSRASSQPHTITVQHIVARAWSVVSSVQLLQAGTAKHWRLAPQQPRTQSCEWHTTGALNPPWNVFAMAATVPEPACASCGYVKLVPSCSCDADHQLNIACSWWSLSRCRCVVVP